MTRTIEQFVCLGVLCSASTCVGQGMYTATDLGKLPYAFGSGAVAVNNSGHIIGYSEGTDGHSIAEMWAPGSQALPIVPSSYNAVNSWAAAINNSGQIAGYFNDRSGQQWPYLYNSKSGIFEVIGSNVDLRGQALGINQRGKVVGETQCCSVFTYDGSNVTLLLPFRDRFELTLPDAINNFGDIAGESTFGGGSDLTAVIYNAAASSWIDVGPGQGPDSGLASINNYGWAVGFSYNGETVRPLVVRDNRPTILTNAPANGGLSAVNDAGLAVGGTFAYDIPSNAWVDLNTRIVNPGVIQVVSASGISPDGKIVGVGDVHVAGGVIEQHAFLLSPTPLYKAAVQPPINADGSSAFDANRGALPVKFTLTENGSSSCTLPQATISVTLISAAAADLIEMNTYKTPADNGSNFRTDACQYTYVLGTKGLGAGDYRVDIIVNWNVVGSGEFTLK